MEIYYNTSGLQKICTSDKEMKKKFGPVRAKLLQRRLNELENAPNLAAMEKLPGAKCHALKGDRKGEWSVALEHPFRLVFAPNHEPLPLKTDGGLNTEAVTSVLILEVVDYHGD